MNKLLKQLVQVLDERGIQVTSLDIVDNTPEYSSIEVNKEISVESRDNRIGYSLYTKEGRLNLINYKSLTEALDVLADYLGKVEEGTILYSSTGIRKYKVIKNVGKDLYNLLEVPHNKLLFSECKGLDYIQEQVDDGVYHAK